MRICFVNSGSLEEFVRNNHDIVADVYCFNFVSVGEICYEKELKGESDKFEQIALLSKKLNAVVVCGCYTDTRGIKRKSVAVAERGKLSGVADANYCLDDKKYKCGAGLKIHQTSAGKIGIIVGEDLLFPEVTKSLSLCGSDVILCVYEKISENIEQVVMRAQAFTYGVNICMCAYAYSQGADIGGSLSFATRCNPFVYELQTGKEYHVIENRQRGFYRRTRDFF